jgi:hypothetical protein
MCEGHVLTSIKYAQQSVIQVGRDGPKSFHCEYDQHGADDALAFLAVKRISASPLAAH